MTSGISVKKGQAMHVHNCMRTEVITVTPQDRLNTALQRMRSHRIRHLPVVDEAQHLLGVLTDRDVRKAGASDDPQIATYDLTYLLDRLTVGEIMTRQVVTVRRDTAVAEAGQILVEKKFGCLPVVQDDHTLEGIVTVTDVLRLYVESHQVGVLRADTAADERPQGS